MYVYNPPFAHLLRLATQQFRVQPTLILLRILGVLGMAALVWSSVQLTRWSLRVQLFVSMILLLESPMLASALYHGSVTPLFAGLPVVALALSQATPILSGVLVGFAIANKPMVVPALAVLLASDNPVLKRSGIAATTAMGLTLLIGLNHLPGLLGKAGGLPDILHNFSLHRVLLSLGLEVSPILLLLTVTVCAGLLSKRYVSNSQQALLLGASLSILSTPSVSTYTYVLAYPALFAAISMYLAMPRPRHLITGSLILLGAVAVHCVPEAKSTHLLEQVPRITLGLLTAVPVLTAPTMALWVLVRNHRDSDLKPKLDLAEPPSSISPTNSGE